MSNTFSDQVLYESTGVGSGGSVSHASEKALPHSCTPALLLLAHTLQPYIAFSRQRQARVPEISSSQCLWEAGSPSQALLVGSISNAPCQHPSPLRRGTVGHGRKCWLIVCKGMDKTRLSHLYNFFGSVQSTRSKTVSQGSLYQLGADSRVETSSADTLVCHAQVLLWLLLRLCVSGAHPCSPLTLPSIAPGKQTRLHIRGRWVSPVVLFSHMIHEMTLQVPDITSAFGLVLNTYKVQASMGSPKGFFTLNMVFMWFGGVHDRVGGAYISL